jgi:hypothetical protein
MNLRLAADSCVLIALVAIALVLLGVLLDELVYAWRHRRR